MLWWRAKTEPWCANSSATATSPASRRGAAEILHRVLESVPELPPAVRLCDGEFGCARQAPAALQSRRLRHPLREAEVAAGGREMPQSGDQLPAAGRLRRGD